MNQNPAELSASLETLTHQQEQFLWTWTCSDKAAVISPSLFSLRKCFDRFSIHHWCFPVLLHFNYLTPSCFFFLPLPLPPRYSNGFIFHLLYKPVANIQHSLPVISSGARADHTQSPLESPHLTFKERKVAGLRRRHKKGKMMKKKRF